MNNLKLKPISARQADLLMDIHERSILQQSPHTTYYMRYGKGLLQRGLIKLDSIEKDGKVFTTLAITEKGIIYLQHTS